MTVAVGMPCGSWCPDGCLAEDGCIPDHYPVVELRGGGYPDRTERNVVDSDETVIASCARLLRRTPNGTRTALSLRVPWHGLEG